MPVFHDPSEARQGTQCPDYVLEMSRPIPRLERMSGADFLISAWDKPPRTKPLIREHVQNGCLLVQRKSGSDLVASLADRRLFQSLWKMIDMGARMPQRVLLSTGLFAPSVSAEGTEYVSVGTVYNEPDAHPDVLWANSEYMNWEQFNTSLDKMIDRGMRWNPLVSDAAMADWFKMKERHLAEYAERNVKILFPLPEYPDQMDARPDSLQIPIVVKDWRLTLSTVPGYGPAKCESLATYGPAAYVWPILSNSLNVGKYLPTGIGPGLVQKFRRHFAIPEGFCYELVPEGHWQHCGAHNILYEGESAGAICPMCKQDDEEHWSNDVAVNLEGRELPGNGAEFDADKVGELADAARGFSTDPPWDTDDEDEEKETD